MERYDLSLRLITILLKASASVEKLLKKDMRKLGLNPTEFSVLELLYHKGPQLTQTISEKVLMASSSITYVLDCLEEKSYVKREQCTKDRRRFYVSLTKTGEELMNNVFPDHGDTIQELLKDLSIEEIQLISEQLKLVGFKASEMEDEI